MIQLVALLGRTDPTVLLCNRKDLIYIWVFKTRDCSSPKSMWFLWNIFSKGTHMLQCLCGKSLKKNKNPSGKLITIYAYSSVSQRTGFMRACVQRVECLRNSVNLVVTMIDLQSHLCSEWIMQRLLKEGRRGGTTYSVLLLHRRAQVCFLGGGHSTETHKAPPLHHHGTMIF